MFKPYDFRIKALSLNEGFRVRGFMAWVPEAFRF